MTAARKAVPKLTREDWLHRVTDAVRPRFKEAGYPLPKAMHISVGFPGKKALSGRVGECWEGRASSDKAPHIFLSPFLNRDRLVKTLLHELVHAATPGAGHKGKFVVACKALGLEGKPTGAEPGLEAWNGWLLAIVTKAGKLPHATLSYAAVKKKQKKGRMVRGACACDPPRPFYASRECWERGDIACLVCDEFVQAAESEED